MVHTQKGGGLFGSNDPYGYNSNYMMENGMSSGVLQYFYYFIVLLIIVLLILVLVHYTITPIFRLRPGDKGVVGLPGSDDSKVYWKTEKELQILEETSTPIGSLTENWSFLLDIQVDNPTANTGKPRILFTRGDTPKELSGGFHESDTILTVNPSFNVCMYLDKLTNDLFISVQTKKADTSQPGPSIETVVLPNLPVRKAVRLGVFIGSRVLEVYVNGMLVRSKAFSNSVASNRGSFQPPKHDILTTTARVGNLHLWPRPLSPSEFRAYGSATNFELKEIADSCVA